MAQVLNHMKLCQFAPQLLIYDVQNKHREWKTDTEVIIKHEVLHARSWESEFERPDTDHDSAAKSNSPKLAV